MMTRLPFARDTVPFAPASRAGRGRLCLQAIASAMLFVFTSQATTSLAASDLATESVAVSPTSGPNGSTVEVTATVRNQGTTNAGASKTRIRINMDPSQVSSGDLALCSLDTPALVPGAAATVGCSPTLTGRPDGTNRIWAIADANLNNDDDPDRANNRRSAAFTITDTSPDLVVQGISVLPAAIHNGEEVTISLTIKNQGSGPATGSTTRVRINQDPAGVTPDDPQVCSILTPSVAAGASLLVKCVVIISSRPAGINHLWAIADANQNLGELDETNNRAVTAIAVSAEASDLLIDSLAVDPTSGPNGEPVSITATIRNQGTSTSFPSKTRVRINLDPLDVIGGEQLCSFDTPAIAVGETIEVSCEPTLSERPEGPNYIWVIADAAETAGQSDRSNDRMNVEFIVDPPPAPDMVVRSLSLNPTSGPNHATVSVSVRIANDGDLASASSKTRIVINENPDGVEEGDTVLCDAISTVALSPGASVQVGCKAAPSGRPPGVNYIWAIADATATSGQTNLENDTRRATYTVSAGAAPDLVVEQVVASPSQGGSEDSVTITARIRNAGNAAAAATTTRFRFGAATGPVLETDPVLCDAVATPVLAAGAAADVACLWTVLDEPLGAASLWATADTGNTAGQVDRSNDSAKTAFTVILPAGPDLMVKRLVVRPTSARNGDTIIVKARIVNIGVEKARASMTTFRINTNPGSVGDGDDVLCTGVRTKALAPDEGVRVRCEVAIADRPLGENTIWAIADTTSTSGQLNLTNDRRRTTLTVGLADCTDPSLPPSMDWPVEQPRVVQDYASYGSVPLAFGRLGYHAGMDLLSQLIPADQMPVYAAADGEVVAIRKTCPSPADAVLDPPNGSCAAGWGNYVVIRHGAGVYSVYAHLGEVFARTGCVVQGDRIAIAGSSGSTSIPAHLHFDVLADLAEPVARTALGTEYYKKSHPFLGRTPENDTGAPQTHMDPRDFFARKRIRLASAAVASRGSVTGGVPAYLARGQEYISYGELVPGYFMIDLPSDTRPQDGPPYADDVRYGWVAAAGVEVLEEGLRPGSMRVEGLQVFLLDGIGANFVAMRAQPTASSAAVARAWGDQQFAPSGAPVTELATGQVWQPVDVPGTSAAGAGKPRQAWLPADLLGPPPAY